MTKTLDEQIADQLRDSERSGELRSAPSWGKPLPRQRINELQQVIALRLEKLRISGSL